MVKVVGPDAKRIGDAVVVNEPASYVAISHIVAQMLARPPFGDKGFNAGDYASGVPSTQFVSEGEAATVMRRGDAYLIRQEQDPWKELR
jgi:hypothetical protein